MNLLYYIAVNIVETFLRGFPVPCKTGLRRLGNPERHSPVLITCNYHLTVERVKRSLTGIDCYLLVANSRGINVWCAATGGHFASHDVISVLKTSGIEKLVDHRNVILPQLAAAGIEAKVIQKKTGWKVIWGPTYAKDIPAFIRNELEKTARMREVKFTLVQRIEMAAMWAFPFSIIAALITIPFWRKVFVPLTILIWILPFLTFVFFPFYSQWISPQKKRAGFSRYTVIFDFSRTLLILVGLFMGCLIVYSTLAGVFTWGFVSRWAFFSFIIILLLSIDLMGSTPVYKSGLHEDRLLKVVLDEGKCKGAGLCEEVCPKNCFEMDWVQHVVSIPRGKQCVQCSACIVQCPFDALYFESPSGKFIPPESIRKYKLNLLGKRL
ncbi:MAG: HgcAB-like fusion protein [Candidatus Zixiibacteriota bacterium]